MKLIKALIPAAALVALAGAPALADVTTADSITCTPDRMGRCKTGGECQWRNASARDKEQLLVVDFKAKTASFVHKGNRRGGGVIIEDKMSGEARQFVISKDQTRNPNTTMELSVDKAGKLTGSRGGGQVKIEASCKVS